MATQTWIRQLLDRRGVPYQELHHPSAYTAQELAQRDHVSGHHVAKVVVIIADGQPVELIVPASRRILLDRVRTLLEAKTVRLATEAELAQFFPDCDRGAIPALRHWPGIPVMMDAAMDVTGDILFMGGTHEDAVRLSFEDWFRIVQPQVAMFSEPLQPSLAEAISD